MENEIWKDVEGYEGRYQVSNLGRVKSLSRTTQLNGRVRKEPETIMAVTYRSGYPTLILRKDGTRKSAQVHRLVAAAFIPNPYEYPVVNHKDYDPTNNNVDNLEWCTQQHNVRWSSSRMAKPREKAKPTNTGEKYIHREARKNGQFSYRVSVHNRRFFMEKTFHSFEDAITYRDEVVKWKTSME